MKKMREINYIFYMVIIYSLSCLYGFFYKNKIADILKFENINFGYVGIFIILVILHFFLLIKNYRMMEDILKFLIKVLAGISIILIGLNYPKQWLIGLIIYMIMISITLFIPREKVKELNNLELYQSREKKEKKLKIALNENDLIALDGLWGIGKTTFCDIFMKKNKDDYYYIPINIMLFENRNSLKTEFLNQLKGIFKEEGIFQGSLMDFDYYLDDVSNDWVRIAKNIIFSRSKSFKEANKKLKSEIEKIEKKIVVGVDNLERIYGESEKEWKEIIGFIYELKELGIKTIIIANFKEMLSNKEDRSIYVYFNKFNYSLNKLEKTNDSRFKIYAEQCLLHSRILADNVQIKHEVFNEKNHDKIKSDINKINTNDKELKKDIVKYFVTIKNSLCENLQLVIKANNNIPTKYEYFDKFYEIKLNLNNLSTKEIIEKIVVIESDVKEWLEDELKNLSEKLIKYFVNIENENKLNENGIMPRFIDMTTNPRKIKKLIDDMQVKKRESEVLFENFKKELKSPVDLKMQRRIRLGTSVFKLYYPEFIKEYSRNGFGEGEFNFYIYDYIFNSGGKTIKTKIIEDKKLNQGMANIINTLLENYNEIEDKTN